VKELGEQLGDQDALLVFFAGHGQVVDRPDHGQAGYLVPHGADLDLQQRTDQGKWAEQALDMQQFVERLDAARARHVLLIVAHDLEKAKEHYEKSMNGDRDPDLRWRMQFLKLAVDEQTRRLRP
jgi:hypothetical protein